MVCGLQGFRPGCGGVPTSPWLVLVLPTLLWWRDSILWLALMSVYGLVAHHLTGWETARTEEQNGGRPTDLPFVVPNPTLVVPNRGQALPQLGAVTGRV